MKKILLTSLLMIITSTSFACQKDRLAKKVITEMEKANIDIEGRMYSDAVEAMNDLLSGKSFCGSLTGGLTALQFCHGILQVAWADKYNPDEYKDLHKALVDFGDLFVSSHEDNQQFNCNLKNVL